MRAGLCAVPQSLTSEASNIVKQAVNLARRRGHAQVTPLHVASAMLASHTGLLRRACSLHSHSHPLQCKALEFCFNVALNRLPASTSSSLLLGPHHTPRPSLSNALVAAFKRAQAYQRRGSIENQQQPILALKIEVEQLVISILDDPSVSRVMREAGFSSSQVKSKVEENAPLDICSQTPIKSLDQENSDDVMSVLNTLVSKKRNTVIVGGCLASTEGVIRGLIDKFERGQAPGDLRYAQFISLPLLSLRNHSKEEVEQKLVELRCLVKSHVGRGIILYLSDLKWVSEFWSTYGEQKRNYYCVVEYIVMEIKRLVFEFGESERLWLMGIANFQTYTTCKAGHPSLENMWKLHPFTISGGSLTLSLNLDSDSPTHITKVQRDGFNWPLLESGAQSMASSIQKKEFAAAAKSTLPSWLQQYKEESRRNSNIIDDEGLCQKWNSFGNKHTQYPEKVLHFSSSSPSFVSVSSQECKQLPKEHQFWIYEISDDEGYESSLRNNPKPDLLSNPNSSPNSASSSEAEEDEEEPDCLNSFKKLTSENLKILSDALESKVPWQKEIIPEIVRTILECRSGAQKQNKLKRLKDEKEETWLLFLGADSQGKEKIAREIAKVVFGSQNTFSSIAMTKKRARNELDCSYIERFGMALNENPHRVFFMEDLEQVDSSCRKGLKQAIENGSITLHGGEIVHLKDSIIIFSCNSFDSLARACSPNKMPKTGDDDEKDGVSLDLNIAVEDIEDRDNHSVGDIRILESVDKQIIFKIQEL